MVLQMRQGHCHHFPMNSRSYGYHEIRRDNRQSVWNDTLKILTSIISSNCVLYCNFDIPRVAREDFLQLIPPLIGFPFIGVGLRVDATSSLIADLMSNRGGGV